MGETEIKKASIYDKLHFNKESIHAIGTFKSSRRRGLFNYILWLFIRIPITAVNKKIEIKVETNKQGKTWDRSFEAKKFITHTKLQEGSFIEKIGFIEFEFNLISIEDQWIYEFVQLKLFKIPLPQILSVKPTAINKQIGLNTWQFDIKMHSPLGREILRYWGEVEIQPKISKL